MKKILFNYKMLLSTTMLNSAMCGYNSTNNDKKLDSYDMNKNGPVANVVATIVLIVAIIFFIFEVLVLIYAIIIAIKCTKSGPERIVHIVLAITFTLPYMLIMSVFSPCGQKVLRGSK